MNSRKKMMVANLMALTILVSVSAFAGSGDKTQVQGMIITRTGETLIVSNPQGRTNVVLTDDTTTKDDRGLFGLEEQQMGNTVLIPGLKVKVEGVTDDEGRVVAKIITVDGDDLETAEMIQSGLHPTAQQVAANVQTLESHRQALAGHERDIAANQQRIQQNMKDIQENTDRFTALSEYDIKDATTVRFDVGSSKISAADQEQLRQVAQTAN
jgi:hypothetical protein